MLRWRLAIGLASLAATVVLTLPPGAARQLGREASLVGANSLTQVADVIWPNDPEFVISDLIWPNLVQVSELAGLTFD